jgi:PAS domain S-box-containing protein
MDLRPDLLATVAHDLRTPLASLQGYLELMLLRQGQLDGAEARNYLHTAVRQSERLTRLVNDLFEWSRLEGGETQPNFEDFALAELLQDVVQRFASEAQQRKVRLSATAPRAPQALVRADIALVERTLVALLENALHHTPAGGSVSVEQGDNAGCARVEVRDTGAGIDAASLAHIFSHYERSERVSGEQGSGEGGLGLAIVRRIVQLHGSELQIASTPGQGTRVRFDLPLARPGAAVLQDPPTRALTSQMPAEPTGAEARVERLQRELERSQAQLEQERAAAQSIQRAFEQRYLLALRGAQDGLWEWDIASDTVLLSPRWKSMLGFDDAELSGDKAGWLSRVHADDRAALEQALQVHLADPQSRFDQPLRLRHKDGRVRHVLSRAVAIRREDGTPYRVVGLDTDVTQVKHVQNVLDAMVEGTAASFGADFFTNLVRHFARALEVDCAFITECADHPVTRVRTLAYWSRSKGFRDSFEFALQGTPCHDVVTQGLSCFYGEGVGIRFPRDTDYESYVGWPIVASDGRVLGHLALFGLQPRGEELLVESVYRVFLARAASEIERLQALAELSKARHIMPPLPKTGPAGHQDPAAT